MGWIYVLDGQPPAPLRDTVSCPWILPRPKQHATGMLFTPAARGPASSNPIIAPMQKPLRKSGGGCMGWIMGFEPTTFRATI